MATINTIGVIIKQNDYGEGHRMLSVFTDDYWIIKAVSYGVKKSKGKSAAASQFLTYGRFDLYNPVNRDVMTVNGIDTIDGFYPISEDIVKLSLCSYLADITFELLGTGNPDGRLLRLFLNTLYALAYRNEDIHKIKAVYELKLMSAGGYAPHMDGCVVCGRETAHAFDTARGGMVCRGCMTRDAISVNEGVYKMMKYITSCDDKKMLAFHADESLIETLNAISEKYVSVQTDRCFKSLDYFKAILRA